MHARISPDIRGLSIALAVCMLLALLFPVRADAQGSGFPAGFVTGAVTAVTAQQLAQLIAQPGFGRAADLMCNPVIPSCPCGHVPTSKGCQFAGTKANKFMCPPSPDICVDTTAGSLTVGT